MQPFADPNVYFWTMFSATVLLPIVIAIAVLKFRGASAPWAAVLIVVTIIAAGHLMMWPVIPALLATGFVLAVSLAVVRKPTAFSNGITLCFVGVILVLSGAFCVAAWDIVDRFHTRHQVARDKHPLTPIQPSVLAARDPVPPQQLDSASQWSIDQLEDPTKWVWRREILGAVHSSQVDHFVRSGGFGVLRMFGVNTQEETIKELDRPAEEDAKLPPERTQLPSDKYPPDVNVDAAPALPLAATDARAVELHQSLHMSFADADRLGYVKDLKQVAGFLPHRALLPKKAPDITVRRVELVSILLHDPPVVYVHDQLPKMDELESAPTRPLSAFEAEGLEQLKQGRLLVVGQDAGGPVMLGAIRSTKDCIVCHHGQRGDLLGAFSYRLQAPLAKDPAVNLQ